MMSDIKKYLEVSICYFKDRFSINSDTEKKIPADYIINFNINTQVYGYTGEIEFFYPYDRSNDILWNDLLYDNQYYTLAISYSQEIIDESSKKILVDNEFKFKVFGLPDQRSYELKELNKGHNKRCLKILMRFTDPISSILKKHYIQEVFIQKSYKEIFEKIFKNLPFNIVFDKSVDNIEGFSKRRAWLAVNCSETFSLYDYLFKTLSFYKIQLSFDYKYNNETESDKLGRYILTSIKDFKYESNKESNSKKIFFHSIDEICYHNNAKSIYFSNVKNIFWDDNKYAEFNKDLKIDTQRNLIKNEVISNFSNRSDFDSFCEDEVSNLTLDMNAISYYNILLQDALPKINILPSHIIQIENIQKDNNDPKDFFIFQSTISYTKNNSVTSYAKYFENKLKNKSHKLDSYINKDALFLDGTFSIDITVCETNKLAMHHPSHETDNPCIKLYGTIYGADDHTDNSYLLNTKKTDSVKASQVNDSLAAEQGLRIEVPSVTSLYYLIDIPEQVCKETKSMRKITAPFYFDNSHQFLPLKNGTVVIVNVYQEDAQIDEIIWIKSIDGRFKTTNNQMNSILLGANENSYTIMKDIVNEKEVYFESITKKGDIIVKSKVDKSKFNFTVCNKKE